MAAMNLTQCRMARAALDLGVRELAELAGVSPDTVSRFERGELPRGKTVELLQSALEARGVEFTNGGQPGVRMGPIDVPAIKAASWSPWKLAPSEADAVAKIRREWPGVLGQSDSRAGSLFFFAPPSDVTVAEATLGEMGGSWMYRTKPRLFIAPARAGNPSGGRKPDDGNPPGHVEFSDLEDERPRQR